MEKLLRKMFRISKEELNAIFKEQPDFFEVCQQHGLKPAEVLKRFQGNPIAGALSFKQLPKRERLRLLVSFLASLWKAEKDLKPHDIFAFAKLTEALQRLPKEEKELVGVLLPDAIIGQWQKWRLPVGLALQGYFLETNDLLVVRERLFEVYKVKAQPEFRVGALFILASELANWLALLTKTGHIQIIRVGGGDEAEG